MIGLLVQVRPPYGDEYSISPGLERQVGPHTRDLGRVGGDYSLGFLRLCGCRRRPKLCFDRGFDSSTIAFGQSVSEAVELGSSPLPLANPITVVAYLAFGEAGEVGDVALFGLAVDPSALDNDGSPGDV